MDAGEPPPFPILRLPEKSRINVLRSMEIVHLLALSLCSEATKEIVKSLHLKVDSSGLNFAKGFNFKMKFGNKRVWLKFYNRCRCFVPSFDIPQFVKISMHGHHVNVFTRKTMRSWLEFLMDVLAIQRIDFSLTTPLDSRNLDIEGLTRVLEGIDIRLLAVDFSSATPRFDELASKLFWANLPSANQVLIRNCLYRDSQDYQKVFIQNLDRLVLKPTLLFTLEDLLSCGSSCIKIPNTSPFTDKDFNLFMKHWIRGSNPNLEYLTINATTDLREHFMTYWYLLKGINFHDEPGPGALRGTYRINGHSGSYHWKHEKIVELKGGVDVENADGTIATIVLWYDEVEVQHLTFEMRVWRYDELVQS